MRYLTLAEALIIAEAVTGLEATTLARASRLELLDSALHAPEAGFGEVEFYPDPIDKAAVLAVRIARNHPASGWQQETGLAGAHHVPRPEWVGPQGAYRRHCFGRIGRRCRGAERRGTCCLVT